jgi:acyl carrier protein
MARRAAGLPALCVRWGAIDDVGFLARNEQIKNALQSRMGGSTIQSADALNILEELLVSDRSNLGVLELDWHALSRFLPSAASPKFLDLAGQAAEGESDEDHADDIQRLLLELSPDELAATFRDLLKAEIGEILRIPVEKLDASRSVYDMGLDSLMGVELALAIESRFGIRLPVLALSESPTIEKLADKIIAQLKAASGTDEPVAPSPAASIAAQVKQTVAQHAADVDSKAVAEFAAEIQAGDAGKSGRIIH